MFRSKDEVTYEAFGIEPAEFYATKFQSPGFNTAAAGEAQKKTLGWDKFTILEDFVRAELAARTERPLRLLDFGCGSGLYGAWLLHQFPGKLTIVGIDMSDACAADALANGYIDAVARDFLSAIPFWDDSFDLVWSMDVWGHIEFRHKDTVIDELWRITKPGGRHMHGIETAAIPYEQFDPSNPHDHIRSYVYIDGHIGVETLDDNVRRVERKFEVKEAYQWVLRPFLGAENTIVNKQWPNYEEALASVDSELGRFMADIFTHRYNSFFRDALRRCFGPILTDTRLREMVQEGPMRDFVLELNQGSGFSFLVLEKH